MTKDYGIKHGTEHYTCMIDLLVRAELIEEAENLLENADCRYDSSLWAVLLGACTKCSDPITAERIAKKMIELPPDHHLSYVLLGKQSFPSLTYASGKLSFFISESLFKKTFSSTCALVKPGIDVNYQCWENASTGAG
ncbi:hypothetical protein K1719_006455 [Acacia pycnantha]|nr:hypothetical protein K1719_006455 [Acacia pycnantha]